jgi:hypothetical protein
MDAPYTDTLAAGRAAAVAQLRQLAARLEALPVVPESPSTSWSWALIVFDEMARLARNRRAKSDECGRCHQIAGQTDRGNREHSSKRAGDEEHLPPNE